MCSALQSAFDRKQLSFDQISRTHFKVRIWDPAILLIPLYNGATRTISSITDEVIDLTRFKDKTIPYRRFLSYHTLICYVLDLFGAQHELSEAFNKEFAGGGVKRERNQYFEGHLAQYHFEMLEETEWDDKNQKVAKKDATAKKRKKYTIAGLREQMKKMEKIEEACDVITANTRNPLRELRFPQF